MRIKCYKGFDKNMQCRGFQYEEGKEYTTDKAELCNSGFHACEYPLDCFGYYAPADSEYHEVELDATDEKDDDTKRVGKRIKIGVRLSIAKMVEASVEYIEHLTDDVKSDTGDMSAATNTGKGGVAIAIGYDSKARGAIGSAICICERGGWNGEEYPLLAIKALIIDGVTLKPDTWYKLVNGEFVEVEE